MKTYLVTGGAGFIGSNFIRYILMKQNGDRVINADKLTYAGNPDNLKDIENNPYYRFFKADICDRMAMNRIFKNFEIDYVVNFAAESHVDRSILRPEVFMRTNVLGVNTLLNCALKAFLASKTGFAGKRFLQVSTDEVYGSIRKGSCAEEALLKPTSPYSASKASADTIALSYYHTYRMPVCIARCANNYGPCQYPEKLIPLVISNCMSARALPVYGNGRNIRDWIYVLDCCRALDMLLEGSSAGEIYNVGGSCKKRNITVIKTIIRVLKNYISEDSKEYKHLSEKLIRYVKDRKGHDYRYSLDCAKIKKHIGFTPETGFKDGIKKTIEWYLDNRGWLDNIYTPEYENQQCGTYEQKQIN